MQYTKNIKMKTLTKLLIPILAGTFGIFGDIKGQDTISASQMDSVEKKIDDLEQSAMDNFNKGKTKYNECLDRNNPHLDCVDTLVKYTLNSKKALEKYNKIIQDNKKYELSYGTITAARTLDSEKTKEWIENEDKLLQLLKIFLESPSREKQEAWMNQRSYTTKLIKSWYSNEDIK